MLKILSNCNTWKYRHTLVQGSIQNFLEGLPQNPLKLNKFFQREGRGIGSQNPTEFAPAWFRIQKCLSSSECKIFWIIWKLRFYEKFILLTYGSNYSLFYLLTLPIFTTFIDQRTFSKYWKQNYLSITQNIASCKKYFNTGSTFRS
jgi:hypothetical protein